MNKCRRSVLSDLCTVWSARLLCFSFSIVCARVWYSCWTTVFTVHDSCICLLQEFYFKVSHLVFFLRAKWKLPMLFPLCSGHAASASAVGTAVNVCFIWWCDSRCALDIVWYCKYLKEVTRSRYESENPRTHIKRRNHDDVTWIIRPSQVNNTQIWILQYASLDDAISFAHRNTAISCT